MAEVGKTRMCVQEASRGVDSGMLEDIFSSAFTESVMIWIDWCTSIEMRQADRMHGTSDVLSRLHCEHMSRNCLDAWARFFLLSKPAQPEKVIDYCRAGLGRHFQLVHIFAQGGRRVEM